MSFMDKLRAAWRNNRSMVCVGLDPAMEKLPAAAVRQIPPGGLRPPSEL